MDKKLCPQCEKEFEYERDSARFCSVNCRVKWNYANRKTKEFTSAKVGAQAILNQAMEVLAEVNGKLASMGSIQPQISLKSSPVTQDEPFTYKPPTATAFKRSVADWLDWKHDIQDEDEYEKFKAELSVADYLLPRERTHILNN